MTIILMLTMFAIFLTIDYFMKRGKVTVEERETAIRARRRAGLPTYRSGI